MNTDWVTHLPTPRGLVERRRGWPVDAATSVTKGDETTTLEYTMAESPTTAELARQLAALESHHTQERAEYRSDMRAGFDELKRLIAAISTVSPEVFLADQARQDAEQITIKSEVTWLRRTIIFGVAALIAGQIVLGLVG